ncbi:glycogen debranching protein GlgX [Propionicicella superfundia]|uniref:glycogen debranching protein GlgX n=1 Tax=Propionicicella superfundia TaxID=348582 RepID=UPI0006886B0E|nr:glycogen debranching protein GlgX [Propionicicella superfundia]
MSPVPQPPSLGARLRGGGAEFAVWAPRAESVDLVLVTADLSQRSFPLTAGDGGVWHAFVPGVAAGQLYGYRVGGSWDPGAGARFNPRKLLLDPYARAIFGGVDYSGPLSDHSPASENSPDDQDSFGYVPLSVVVADTPPPRPLRRRRPLDEWVIYETHLRGYTRAHPAVPEHLRGTFAGLAYPAVIESLVDLGVNAVELLPVQHFCSEPFVHGRGMSNYWGYNTLGFFAPHAHYAAGGTAGQQVAEFKHMVSALHDAGVAVILDVVYNHTAEGAGDGPTLSFRGIDQGAYYRLSHDNQQDYDVTGCGNAVNTASSGVLRLVLDSLRYWVTEMGVDGFRFDLATTLIRDGSHHVDQNHAFKQAIAEDPVLQGIAMIAEPWDLGPYGYQVGAWGDRWAEWNDHYRGYVRDFWRGATHGVQELATRLSGSADIYDHGRPITASVNFITAHDGFTLRDVVTYDLKHNEANGERNRDGTDDNRSWNHGYEGETTDRAVNAARRRTARNMLATLLLSWGTPMMLAGDERGRTQRGNNNAYCQDNAISWLDWSEDQEWADTRKLVRTITRLRAKHPVLRPAEYRHGDEVLDAAGAGLGRKDIAWFRPSGEQMRVEDWHNGALRTLGMYVSDVNDAFLMYFHGDADPIEVTLPGRPWSTAYTVSAHTGNSGEILRRGLVPDSTFSIPGRTVVVLKATVARRRRREQHVAPSHNLELS